MPHLLEPDKTPERLGDVNWADSVEDADLPRAPRNGGRTSTLTTDIGKVLLRAVNVSVLMHSFGKVLASSGGTLQVTAEDYDRSRSVQRIDDFISHSWKTGRWPKFLTLCLVYNLRAASVASWLAAILVFFLELDAVSFLSRPVRFDAWFGGQVRHHSMGVWGMLVCPLTFLVVGVFWQNLVPQRMVFVDKFCIHQTDPQLKKAGIRGIAGFLRHSDRLVVLWTGSYFTRLWCTYELASWIHLGKSHIHFVPVSFAAVAGMMMSGLFAQFALVTLFRAVTGDLPLMIILLSLWMFCLLVTVSARRHVRELSSLENQLSAFSVQKTQCYCCDFGHVNPLTDEPMPCDRQLVYDALKDWFSEYGAATRSVTSSYGGASKSLAPDTAELSHLDFFDAQVRARVHSQLISMGSYQLSYSHALMMASPFFWHLMEQATYLESLPWLEWARFALHVMGTVFVAVPITYRMVFVLCTFYQRVLLRNSKIGQSRLLQALVTVVSAVSLFCISAALWFLASNPFYHTASFSPLILVTFFLCVLCALIFCGCDWHRLRCSPATSAGMAENYDNCN